MMTSIDTNVLLAAVEADNVHHRAASGFLESLQDRYDVVISEFFLLELYGLLRNPAVLSRPLGALAASQVCMQFRSHPRWQLVGFPPDSRAFQDQFWPRLRDRNFARRRAFDWRAALSLLRNGVTELATANVRDFQGFGFTRVWNPLE